MIDPVVSVAVRCLLSMLFVSAAWHKLADFQGFVLTLGAYRLVPRVFAKAVAAFLVAAEVTLTVLLLLPTYRWAALGAVALLSVYSLAIAINLMRGRREIDCGCFAPGRHAALSPWLLLRNGLLISVGFVATLPLRDRPLVWVDVFDVIVIVTAAALTWVSFWRLRNLAALPGGQR